jgi:molecular chaperone HtpG
MSVDAKVETFSFDADVNQVMDLVINSMYTNNEVFVRELISNASDAADKLRYNALSDSSLYEDDAELQVSVEMDEDKNTITISDNGVGMSREDVVENLGTIARSGTRAFKELLSADASKDSQLIGQFGVGFYAAFLVADKVTVRTRRAGFPADQAVFWNSDGRGEYTIKSITKQRRGTEITLHLRDDRKEFLNDFRLRGLISKYSDHIALPVKMAKPLTDDDKKKKEEGEIIVPEMEVVNKASALWTLSKSEIKDEQYQELYKHISHDFEDPLTWAHNKVEGKHEYTTLLYIPKRAPFDLWDRDHQHGLKLYVKRVFIMDDSEHFMPTYLRFVKGIVDSNDLPLNVSREMLQQNHIIDRIKSGCVKRVLTTLEKIAKDKPEDYAHFWSQFGQLLKEGPGEDSKNKERIAKLLRFSSTKDNKEQQDVTLDDYLERMSDKQDKIYYLISDNFTSAKNSPLLEVFNTKGIEVLLMSDRVDEWLMSHLNEYQGKSFQSISQGKVDLEKFEDSESKEKQKQAEKQNEDFVKQMKDSLGDKVSDVRVTNRLTDSPCCVVFDEDGMSGHMQRIMQAAGQSFPAAKPVLELNPEHPLIAKVKADNDEIRFTRWSELLFNQAMLAEGEQLLDPAGFVKDLNQILLQG